MNDVLSTIYNLILNPATTDWEREQLQNARTRLANAQSEASVLADLVTAFRPLALRRSLTPDVTDLYMTLTADPASKVTYDFKKHRITDIRHQERAIFAGGCFWCMVEPFETHPGIVSVLSGYTGGNIEHPTYAQVSSGRTGHVEAVEIIFDKRIVSYTDLLDLYWQISDPTDNMGQFGDRGENYRPIIFTTTPEQMELAKASRAQLASTRKFRNPIVTDIRPATTFWPAENYHQQFYKKFPKRYKALHQERVRYLFFQRLFTQWHNLTTPSH
jgi:peptide-methionine (S)-S-oxide reductase